ncbi:MAG: hypothetical protein WCQ57_02875 [Verrucomicrobiota bacterium]
MLRPTEMHAEIMEKFPGGKKALLREMRRLKMPSVASLVDQRRLELCYAWRTYGNRSFEEILPALKVPQPKRFLARYERWLTKQETVRLPNLGTDYSDSLLAAYTPYLPSIRGQYWQRQNVEADKKRYHHRMATDCAFRESEEWNRNLLARDGVAPPQPPPAPPKLSGEVDSTFWEMKNTGVKMLIKAEELSSIPGLEDCVELLCVGPDVLKEAAGFAYSGARDLRPPTPALAPHFSSPEYNRPTQRMPTRRCHRL